jgi:hypothetical protein
MGDPLTIIDSAGHACYSVRTVPDVAERLSLSATGGGELAAIVRMPRRADSRSLSRASAWLLSEAAD